ncbi:MAG: protein kinase [Polyangiaceae bacterium]
MTAAVSLPAHAIQRVGNYELLLELAAGGMATVHVARQVASAGCERLVVITRVHAHLVKDRAFTDMFRDEARVCSTIRHPNVVAVTDVVETGGELLLVLEYVESLSMSALADLARSSGSPLAPSVVSRILCDALAGLHAAHEASDLRGNALHIIHRDVSPQNIIVGLDGTSRLIDFGIAKAASRATTTTSGILKGKLRYMSPEQVRQKPLDRRADVFAAGVVLYEALTGQPPFPGDDAGDIAMSILLGEPPSVTSIVPSLPAAIDAVIEKALAGDRDDRYATAADLAQALEAAIPPAPVREVASVVEALGARVFSRRRADLAAALEGDAVAPGGAVSAGEVATGTTEVAPRGLRGRALGAIAGLAVIGAASAFLLRGKGATSTDADALRTPSAPETASVTAPSSEPLAPTTASVAPTTTASALESASLASPSSSASPSTLATSAASTARSPRGPKRAVPKAAASTDLHRRNPYATP